VSDPTRDDDAFVSDLLAAERRRPDVPAPAAEALLHSILAASAQAESPVSPANTASPAPAQGGQITSSAPSSLVRSLLASRPLLAIASLTAGIGIGASARPLFDPPTVPPPSVVIVPAKPTATSVPREIASEAPSLRRPDELPPAPTPARPATSPAARVLTAPASSASVPPASGRSPQSTLGAERALIDTARSALARGDAAAALASLDAHEKNHRDGQLGEERDALAVQALAQSGRKQEAVERAARFRLAYPGSVFLPSVDAAAR